MPKIFETAKVLPVRVLKKTINNRLVALTKGVLEVMKTNHQTDRLGRTALTLTVARTELGFEYRPVNSMGELDKRVVHVEDLIETRLEKLEGTLLIFVLLNLPPFT